MLHLANEALVNDMVHLIVYSTARNCRCYHPDTESVCNPPQMAAMDCMSLHDDCYEPSASLTQAALLSHAREGAKKERRPTMVDQTLVGGLLRLCMTSLAYSTPLAYMHEAPGSSEWLVDLTVCRGIPLLWGLCPNSCVCFASRLGCITESTNHLPPNII